MRSPWSFLGVNVLKALTSAIMASRKRQLVLGLFLFFCLVSRLLVLSVICNTFKILPYTPPFVWPEWRSGASDVSPKAGISGLSFDSIFLSLLLFCLVLLLLPSSPFGPVSSLLSRKFFELFSRDILFCMAFSKDFFLAARS